MRNSHTKNEVELFEVFVIKGSSEMIISHEYKYLFVEIPHTASTAISHELRANYKGEKILRKHSFYSDFLKIASPKEKTYLVFAGIRNPLDESVTRYYKLKVNSREEPHNRKEQSTSILESVEKGIFKDSDQNDANFQAYFLKHYKLPYNNYASFLAGHYDYLIRFENLQEDFAHVLQILGLEQKRPLPVRNSTKNRKKDFWSYYTPEMIPKAKWVFGPFMQQWDYKFPPEWGDYRFRWWIKGEYSLFSLIRKVKWKYLRFL